MLHQLVIASGLVGLLVGDRTGPRAEAFSPPVAPPLEVPWQQTPQSAPRGSSEDRTDDARLSGKAASAQEQSRVLPSSAPDRRQEPSSASIRPVGAKSAATAPGHRPASATPAIALTFDDIPAHGALPPGVTRAGILHDIVAALTAARAPAYGFLNAAFGAGDPSAAEAIATWRRAGLPVGNHGRDHRNLDALSTAEFEEQLVGNEAAVAAANDRAPVRWFRYPFLAEGSTPASRSAARAVLARRGYRIAAVTMSFGDFTYNDPYARCARRGDAAGVATLEAQWLAAARDQAERQRARARALLGRHVPLVLLMHVGAFDARMLPRTLALYRQLGFRFVTLEEAQADPFYAAANDPRLPGPSPTLDGPASPAPPSSVPARPAPDLGKLCQ